MSLLARLLHSVGGARVAVGAILLVAAVGLFYFNPSTTGVYPLCPFHELTGLYCPGCGSTRALHCLLHGELRGALRDNALVVVALPVLAAILLARAIRRRPPLIGGRFKAVWLGLLLAGIMGFGVARNIPHHPFSLLAPPVEAAGK